MATNEEKPIVPETPVTPDAPAPVETPSPAADEKPAASIVDDSDLENAGDEPYDMLGVSDEVVDTTEEAETEPVAKAEEPAPTIEDATPAETPAPSPIADGAGDFEPPAPPPPSAGEIDYEAIDPEAVAEDPEVVGKIAEEAKREAAKKLGEEFDEFNPKHIALFTNVANRLTKQVVQEVSYRKQSGIADRKMKTLLPTEDAHKFAVKKFQDLPYREAKKILAAEQNGDFETVLGFFQKCREEFDGLKDTKKKADQKFADLKKTAPVAPSQRVPSAQVDTAPDDDDADGLELFGMNNT